MQWLPRFNFGFSVSRENQEISIHMWFRSLSIDPLTKSLVFAHKTEISFGSLSLSSLLVQFELKFKAKPPWPSSQPELNELRAEAA